VDLACRRDRRLSRDDSAQSPVSRRHERHAVRGAESLDSRFNVNYHLGVDGISVLFILLNSFITVLVVLAGWEVIQKRWPSTWLRSCHVRASGTAPFAALDAVLFLRFLRGDAIPCTSSSASGAGPTGSTAAVKFFPVHPLLGSLLMLIAFLTSTTNRAASFACPRLSQAAAASERADPAVHRFPYGVRGEGADVARAPPGSRTLTSSATGGLGSAGGIC